MFISVERAQIFFHHRVQPSANQLRVLMDQKGWGRVESISFCPCMLDLLSPLDSGADTHSSKSDTQTLGLELRFSSWVPVLGLWPRTEQHSGCAGSPAYYWQMVGFLGPNNPMSQFPHISPQESLCIHAVCCVCQNDPDGHTHPSEGFTELLSVFLLSKTVVLFSCEYPRTGTFGFPM